jgi:hypothetical protein
MIVPILGIWLAVAYFSYQEPSPDCVDVINSQIKLNGLQNAQTKVENYPEGMSIFFKTDDVIYDYLLTNSPDMHQEAIKHEYSFVGQCSIEDNTVVILTKAIIITEEFK